MKRTFSALPPAAESAAVVLSAATGRWEVLSRQGRTLSLRWWAGTSEERVSEEGGVACRVSLLPGTGFAAASGRGARAGRQAAEVALQVLLPGPDTIPPVGALGCTPVPPLPAAALPERLREVAVSLRHALEQHAGIELVELRASSGEARSHLLTGEGHAAESHVAGAAVELVLAADTGPARLVRWAGHSIEDLDVAALAERSAETVLVCSRGTPVRRRLADVVLAPAAAAPLVLALVERLQHAGGDPADPLRSARVALPWRLVDERAGPDGLLPQPFDGEGLPSRSHPLLAEGRIGPPLLTWGEAVSSRQAAGGAVRPSYRQAPCGGPANLVVHPTRPLASRALVEHLDDGFWVDLPAGPVQVDASGERFILRAAAVAVTAGRPVSSHPVVELRGSFRRLMGGLAATGLDGQSFSLGAAVTTPSLLVRKLEMA